MMRLLRIIRLKWYHWSKYGKWEHPLYKEYLYIKDLIKAWWKARQLNKAKKLAIARHKGDGKTYYVLPDDKGIPRAFNNREIDILKRNRLMHKSVTCVDLYKEAMFIANYKTCSK